MADHTTLRVIITNAFDEDQHELTALINDRPVIEPTILSSVVTTRATRSGKCAVALLCELPNGKLAYIETTAALWEMVNSAAKGAQQRIDREDSYFPPKPPN